LRQRWYSSLFLGEAHINIQCPRRALFNRWLWLDDIRFFKHHGMFFDLRGTAKSRNYVMSAFTTGT
jgi:hypothetical protein